MVEFLLEQGADINRGDSEGWTPLHATASCGFISIAKLVIFFFSQKRDISLHFIFIYIYLYIYIYLQQDSMKINIDQYLSY